VFVFFHKSTKKNQYKITEMQTSPEEKRVETPPPATLPSVRILVAMTRNGAIGCKGGLPWPNLTEDKKRIQELTKGHVLLMGTKTFASLRRPKGLAGRIHLLVSSKISPDTSASPKDGSSESNLIPVSSLSEGIQWMQRHATPHQFLFVLGGVRLYREALLHPACTHIHVTQVLQPFPADTFFPVDLLHSSRFHLCHEGQVYIESKHHVPYQFLEYKPTACLSKSGPPASMHPEMQYLDLIKRLMSSPVKPNRTGIPTHFMLGEKMRFSLGGNTLPLFTTKHVPFRQVAGELLWMLSGSTSTRVLSETYGVRIWDANGTREALDKKGLTDREEGDLGPMYGFQWRHFGATYLGQGKYGEWPGIDQIQTLIQRLKTTPESRDMILTSWNPKDIPHMALSPCHVLAHFIVLEGKYLHCHLLQRSADVGLGVPFNVASYSLLTMLLAHFTGLQASELVYTMNDCHLYVNHVEPLQAILAREPYPFPTLEVVGDPASIDHVTLDHLKLHEYVSHGKIAMKMAV
jgi:thymidylate synthase